jgi:hypothetical protein
MGTSAQLPVIPIRCLDPHPHRNITTEAAIPTSCVSVTKWRVWLWLALHAIALFIGVLFLALSPKPSRPWIGDSNFAALLTNAEQFRTVQGWTRDPWEVGTGAPSGMLTLEKGGSDCRDRQVLYGEPKNP